MNDKPPSDPQELVRTSGRDRMVIDYPVVLVREPSGSSEARFGAAALVELHARRHDPGQDYTALEILAKQASTPLRYASIVEGRVEETAPLLGVAAALAIQGRRHDPRDPAALEAGLRKFNPMQPRDPGGEGGGQWVKGPASAAKAAAKLLGRISEDDFFEGHGEDYYDQYGAPDLSAILWKNGTASLYQDLGKGKVRSFGDVDSKGARRLSGDLKWAVGQPESGTPGGGKLAGQRETDLGHITAEVGYGYDGNGDLFVRVTMPAVGSDKKPTVIDLEDLDVVEGLVGDLTLLADELDSGAYLGDTPGISRSDQRAVTPAGIKGAKQLHDYWTKGEGLAKWADSPHPWTALYHHLLKYMSPGKAKRTASQWFHDVFGIWPGDREGDNPVGPG